MISLGSTIQQHNISKGGSFGLPHLKERGWRQPPVCRPHKRARSSVLWMKKSTALRSCFLSFSNDTRLLMDNFQSAFTGISVGESLPHLGTSLRLRRLHTPLGFSMYLSFKRLILYYNVKDDTATAQSNLGAGRSLSFLKPPRLLSCIWYWLVFKDCTTDGAHVSMKESWKVIQWSRG